MAKTQNSIGLPTGLFWLLCIALPLLKIESLQDSTLLSRWILLGLYSAAGLFLVKGIWQGRFPRWTSLLFMGLAIWSLLSFSWAYNPSESYALAARIMVLPALFFVLYYQVKSGVLSKEHLLKGLILFAAASSLPALWQLFKSMGSGAFFEDIYVIKANYSHKNLLASALMLSFPFVIAGWSILKGAWSRFSMILALIMLVEMFVLRTRGVWLSLFVASAGSALALRILKPKGIKISKLWTGVFLGGAAFILLALFLSPQIKAGFTNSSNVQKRLAFWDNSMEMIQEHPLTGVGGGNWKLLFPKYGLERVDNMVMQGQTHIQRPHNDYLWIWSELGPAGLLLFMGLLALPLLSLWKALSVENQSNATLLLATLFSLLSFASFAFADFPMERAPHMFFLVLFAVIVGAYAQAGASLPKIALSIPIFLAISLGINGIRFQQEREAKTLIEVDYEGATLGQRLAGQNPQIIRREQERIASNLAEQSEVTYNERFYTVDNFAMPVMYFATKANLFSGNTNLEKAKQDLSQAFEDAPYNILNYQLLIEYHLRMGARDSAYFYIDRALELSPHFNELILKKAQLMLEENRHLDALGVLNFYPFQSQDQRYLDMLTQSLVKAIQSYPAQHQRYEPMMKYFGQFNIDSPQKLQAVYRRFREARLAQQTTN